MTTARARRYPQPPLVAELLAAERCDHGEITGRCALCRMAAEPSGDQAPPEPTKRRPPRPTVADSGDQDDADQAAGRPGAPTPRPPGDRYADDDPRSVAWWDR